MTWLLSCKKPVQKLKLLNLYSGFYAEIIKSTSACIYYEADVLFVS